MELWTYLWVGESAPPQEYLDLHLCRDVYHCAPSVLFEQDNDVIQAHLVCLDVEARVRKQREQQAKGGR